MPVLLEAMRLCFGTVPATELPRDGVYGCCKYVAQQILRHQEEHSWCEIIIDVSLETVHVGVVNTYLVNQERGELIRCDHGWGRGCDLRSP